MDEHQLDELIHLCNINIYLLLNLKVYFINGKYSIFITDQRGSPKSLLPRIL